MPTHLNNSALSIALCLTGLGLPMSSQATVTLEEALTSGNANMDIRLRYESVEQNNALEDASATTVRTRLGYTTGEYKNFKAFVEMESISALGDEDYNSKTNGKTTHSVVADPTGAEMNQINLSYTAISDTVLKWGRQRMILDNARFVGNVGWRQNEQTLDAFIAINKSLPDTTATYAYVYNVNDIIAGDTNIEAHLLNVAYSGLDVGQLSGYGYLLDFVDAPTTSQQTLGLRFSGSKKIGSGTKLLYTAEYATQSDYKDGVSTIDADYLLGELGASSKGVTIKVGYEVLGGGGTYGFSTPLATKHAFNGWSDQFLATPADGLVDLYVSVAGKVAGIKFMAVYHDFSADQGSAEYGSEFGLLAAKKFTKHYSVVLKYSSYSADTHGVDTDKLWVQGQVKF
ncbi:MAG: alginate export family protein [Pseudomonadales bacterium]|nr:alginate export family protein [Pseudomonadales bacterium]